MFQLLADAAPGQQTFDGVSKTVEQSNHALLTSFQQAWQKVIDFAPRVVAMMVVLVVGYIIARLVARVIALLCEKIGLQHAADRSGLTQSMQHMGIKRTVSAIVGTIVFWLLMCVFLMAAFEILDLPAVSAAMGAVAIYIPKLLVATVVVVGGLLIASFLRGVVATSADRVGLSYAEYLAAGCYYVLAVLTFYTALTQLGMKFELLNDLILIGFAGMAIGFGLAFGLGGREVIGGILAGYYVRQRLQAGDRVSIGRMEGTVREVGPVATIIETDEDGLLNRHSVPNTKMLNEAIR
ncbi:MAG TPA: mechanosensitive ion channel domain-containing protein [Pirellulales bacterium]|jgi:small-conductance mechanosensitive channel|nr:mechanosensitive ion channel domain-containing protein [Pirellulales bacterium]